MGKKIAMIVYNSVSRDARVLKEAESLVNAGYRVRIFGIRDNHSSVGYEKSSDGVEIVRAEWKSLQYRLYSRLTMLAVVAILFGVNVPIWLGMHGPLAIGELGDLLATAWEPVSNTNAAVFGASIVSILCIVFGYRRIYNFRRNARRYAAAGSAMQVREGRARRLIQGAGYLFKRLGVTRAMQLSVFPLLKDYEPDALHCHDLTTLPAGAKYGAKYAVPVVYDSHEIYEEQGSFGRLQKVIFYLVQRWYSDKVSRFITINESIADFLGTRYPALPQAVIVKNASKPLEEPAVDDGRLHQAAGLDHDTRILLYQGGFGPRRGLEVLVQSAPLLPENWCLVMMGWGSLESRLRLIAEHIDPEGEKIRFVPGVPQSELPYWTAGATIGIIPYENVNLNHWYCTPNKLWEYPNAGVPVLVSPFPEMERIVKTYNIGWPLDDELAPHRIAGKIAELSDEEIRRAAENCRDFIAQDNWTNYEKRLVDLYHQLWCYETALEPTSTVRRI